MVERRNTIEGPLDVEQFRRRRPQEDVISVLALGTFDGVHLGHQAILREALTLKERLSAQWDGFRMETVAFTFDALPLRCCAPKRRRPV